MQSGLHVKLPAGMAKGAADVVATDFDPFSPDVVRDPYPWYAALHDGPRVLHQERWDLWVLSRLIDVSSALRDHRLLSSTEGVTFLRAPTPMMLTQDPPNHERLRRIVGREFAPRDIHRFRPAIERFVREGLDDMAAGPVGDIVQNIAMPVPIRVMAEILGVSDEDIPDLRRMADDLVKGFSLAPDASTPDGDVSSVYDFELVAKAASEILLYFSGLIAERRERPTDDLLTKLMRGELSEPELLWFGLLLLVAGIETTTNLIGNMAIAFIDHPVQWELLRSDPELITSAVNESLRFDPPIQGFFRTSLAPYVVDGVEIPTNARVLLAFGAANRDPERYSEPEAFKIERNPTDHMSFGAGIHRCLGAGLAELEGRIVLEQLLERTDALELAGDIVRTTNPTLRGALSVPLDTSGWRR